MTPTEAKAFAEKHCSVWNTHDLDRILDLYADDAELASPLAAQLTGGGVVEGPRRASRLLLRRAAEVPGSAIRSREHAALRGQRRPLLHQHQRPARSRSPLPQRRRQDPKVLRALCLLSPHADAPPRPVQHRAAAGPARQPAARRLRRGARPHQPARRPQPRLRLAPSGGRRHLNRRARPQRPGDHHQLHHLGVQSSRCSSTPTTAITWRCSAAAASGSRTCPRRISCSGGCPPATSPASRKPTNASTTSAPTAPPRTPSPSSSASRRPSGM